MANDFKLINLKPYSKNVSAIVIVLDSGTHRGTSTGTIITMVVADDSGSINLSLINPDYHETFQNGDILRIKGGQGSLFESRITLNVNFRTGECKKIGDFMMTFSTEPYLSKNVYTGQVTSVASRAPSTSRTPSGLTPPPKPPRF